MRLAREISPSPIAITWYTMYNDKCQEAIGPPSERKENDHEHHIPDMAIGPHRIHQVPIGEPQVD